MKKLISLFILFIFITSASASDKGKVVLENKSKLGFEETVEHITVKAKEKGWMIPVVHDLQKSVGKAGYEVRPVKVIEICNPHFASKILAEDESRIITPMMPLRISVYEHENGDVIIARFNPDMVSKMFGDIGGETLLQACATSEDIVKDIIN